MQQLYWTNFASALSQRFGVPAPLSSDGDSNHVRIGFFLSFCNIGPSVSSPACHCLWYSSDGHGTCERGPSGSWRDCRPQLMARQLLRLLLLLFEIHLESCLYLEIGQRCLRWWPSRPESGCDRRRSRLSLADIVRCLSFWRRRWALLDHIIRSCLCPQELRWSHWLASCAPALSSSSALIGTLRIVYLAYTAASWLARTLAGHLPRRSGLYCSPLGDFVSISFCSSDGNQE